MNSRYVDRERYFNELARTSEEYYVDYIKACKSFGPGSRVLEVGCGEGGNLLPFARMGCYVRGMDMSANKIANARKFFAKNGVKGEFHAGDFLAGKSSSGQDLFDIVLVHDVIEHIEPEMKGDFFRVLRSYVKDDGIVFFGFPAWQMPFGGHQQACGSRICSKIPFVHLLPAPVYGACLRMFGEERGKIEELMSIKRSRMTPELFERLAEGNGYKVLGRTLWLISPHYEVKFGLRPRKLWGWMARLPYVRNYFSTSCFYLLTLAGRSA